MQNNNSIVDYLAGTGQDSSYAARARLAQQKGISGYRGTTQQNLQLLGFLRGNKATTAVGQSQNYINQPIDAAQLGVQSRPIPAPITTNTAQTNLGTRATTFTEGIAGNQQMEQEDAQAQSIVTPKGSREGILGRISELLGVQSGQGAESASIFEEEGVQSKKDLLRKIENEALAKDRAYQKQAEKIRQNSEGKLESGVNIELNDLDRQRNSELADLAIQQQVAQGNYQSAYEIADAKVKAKFEPIENQIKSLQNLYQLYGDDMTESEKMLAEEKMREKREELDFERQKELIDYRSKIEMAEKLRILSMEGIAGRDPMALIAYAQQYASTGTIPTGMPKGTFGIIAQLAKETPKPEGTVVDVNTGVKPSKLSGEQLAGISALKDLTNKLNDMKTISKFGGPATVTRYRGLRNEIVDLLSRARSGAALTETEISQYLKKVPSINSLVSGAKIDSLQGSIDGKLKTTLSTNGVAIYGYSKVKLGDRYYTVGETITNGNGMVGRVNADGSITLIQ